MRMDCVLTVERYVCMYCTYIMHALTYIVHMHVIGLRILHVCSRM